MSRCAGCGYEHGLVEGWCEECIANGTRDRVDDPLALPLVGHVYTDARGRFLKVEVVTARDPLGREVLGTVGWPGMVVTVPAGVDPYTVRGDGPSLRDRPQDVGGHLARQTPGRRPEQDEGRRMSSHLVDPRGSAKRAVEALKPRPDPALIAGIAAQLDGIEEAVRELAHGLASLARIPDEPKGLTGEPPIRGEGG